MTIFVNDPSNVRTGFGNRYFVIRDEHGTYRVVSATKMSELSPYVDSSGAKHYKFAHRAGGYQQQNDQRALALAHRTNSTRPASQLDINKLVNAGVVALRDRVVTPVEVAAPSITVGTGQFGGGYVIGSLTSTGISFSSNPKVHATSESAETEAERLASVNPGKEFVVFKATMSAVKASVVTRKF